MKRILPLLLVLPLAAFACKSKESKDNDNGAQAGGGGENGQNGGAATPEELAKNPIEGIQPAKAVVETFGFTDGPVWHKDLNVLIFSMPLGETPSVWRMLPDGRRIQLREGGKRKYEAARQVAVELQSDILSGLPEERREEFLEDLAVVADACKSAAELSPKRAK